MNNYLTLKEIQQREKLILDYIADICEKNNLRYTLAYGTLLGAVRHKGFIPWDDDVDISLPRPDYEKLIEILVKNPSDKFKLYTPDTTGYFYTYAKVSDTETKIVENYIDDIDGMGIWIDIFPFDGSKGKNSLHSKICHILQKCRAASVYSTFPKGRGGNWFLWKICRIVGYKFFLKAFVKLSKKHKYSKCDLVVSTNYQHHFPRQIFEEYIKVDFDGNQYDAVKDYDQYLKILFNDYMTLPPESDRVDHNLKVIYNK